MKYEIERKFLVKGDSWRKSAKGHYCCQGYLCSDKNITVRVRIYNTKAFITVKGPTIGIKREEYEYQIPVKDAREMLDNHCQKTLIEKIRYKIDFKNNIWEIDEFKGENKGLILAEIELNDEEQKIELPEWIDIEVSKDPRYFNSNLSKIPYSKWTKK